MRDGIITLLLFARTIAMLWILAALFGAVMIGPPMLLAYLAAQAGLTMSAGVLSALLGLLLVGGWWILLGLMVQRWKNRS